MDNLNINLSGSFSSCDDKSDPDYPSEMVVLDAADGSVIDMLNVAMKISAD